MSDSREQKGLPQKVWLYGSHWWLEPRGDGGPYVPEALISEAVRVARTGMLKEMEQTVSKAAACGNLQGNIIRAFLQRFKAASTEGGNGGE